jgi:hypothetical protein
VCQSRSESPEKNMKDPGKSWERRELPVELIDNMGFASALDISLAAAGIGYASSRVSSFFWPGLGRSGCSETCGRVLGMATTKITITIEDDQVEDVRALVAAGRAASVSAFLKHAVGVALSDAAGWREMLEDALR